MADRSARSCSGASIAVGPAVTTAHWVVLFGTSLGLRFTSAYAVGNITASFGVSAVIGALAASPSGEAATTLFDLSDTVTGTRPLTVRRTVTTAG